MKRIKRMLFSVCLLGMLSFSACAQPDKINYQSPIGYDFNQPKVDFIWDVLHEVSGITFYEEIADTLFAVEDETGTIYRFLPSSKDLKQSKFAKDGDYEGIAISNGYAIVLKSNGTLYTLAAVELNKEESEHVKEWKDLVPKGEYESLAASSKDSLLYVICKQCSVDKKTKKTTGYRLRLTKAGVPIKDGEFEIDNQEIDALNSLKGKDFRPSALARNNRTNEWFILSSINKLLVVADENWKVKATYPLDPDLFNQPEGIAFDAQGNLYISNEGSDKTQKASLVRFTLIH